jgi:hypothetical protein
MGSQRRHIQRKNGSSPQRSGESSADVEKPGRSKSKSSPRFSGREAGSLSDVPLTPGDMLYLQRTVGNRAVNRLIQAKPKIGQPGDEYEQEADQVAAQVPRVPEGKTANASQTVGGRIQRYAPKPEDELQHQAMPEEEQLSRPDEASMVQMKEAAASGYPPGQAISPEEEERRKLMEEG